MPRQHKGFGAPGQDLEKGASVGFFPVVGKDDFLPGYHSVGPIPYQSPSMASFAQSKIRLLQHSQQDQSSPQSSLVPGLMDFRGIGKGLPFQRSRQVVTMDASLFGWGSHLDNQVAQGQWSLGELLNDINWLELRVAHLALQHFQPMLTGQHVLLMTDNVTAKAHVNCQGGTLSKALMHKAMELCIWAEKHLHSLRVEHISGVANAHADWLSCMTIDQSEWHLHPDLFHHITTQFGLVHQSEECPAHKIFLLLLDASGRKYQRPPSPLACRSAVCISSSAPHSEGYQEDFGGGGRGATSGTPLATTSVVCGFRDAVCFTPLEDPSSQDLPQPGGRCNIRTPSGFNWLSGT